MRNTILSLTVLTLSLGLVGCNPSNYALGNPNGLRVGDNSIYDPNHPVFGDGDSAPTREFDFHQTGLFVAFPFSDQGPAVQAGEETVAFLSGSNQLSVRGLPVPSYTVSMTGGLLWDGQLIGYVVYTESDDGLIGTALISLTGKALEIVVDGDAETARLVETDATLILVDAERAPRNEMNIPVAQPVV